MSGRLGVEIIAGRVAIEQALFFHFGLTIRQIAELLGVKYCTVYFNVQRGEVLRWRARRHQDEAIAAARTFLPTPES